MSKKQGTETMIRWQKLRSSKPNLTNRIGMNHLEKTTIQLPERKGILRSDEVEVAVMIEVGDGQRAAEIENDVLERKIDAKEAEAEAGITVVGATAKTVPAAINVLAAAQILGRTLTGAATPVHAAVEAIALEQSATKSVKKRKIASLLIKIQIRPNLLQRRLRL